MQDFRFQFMNTVRVADKPLNITYIHSKGDNRTILDGTFVWDPSNKISANYGVESGNCRLKYSYVHKGLTAIEPSYDVAKNAWDFAVSRKVYGDDSLKATYQTTSKKLGFEWSRNSKQRGCFKVSCWLLKLCFFVVCGFWLWFLIRVVEFGSNVWYYENL